MKHDVWAISPISNRKRSKWQIHHNKDWNRLYGGQTLWLYSQSKWQIHHNKDWNESLPHESFSEFASQNDKSIITRIETVSCILIQITEKGKSKWQIHHNKDWNDMSPQSMRTFKESKWQIHHNKDWNQVCTSQVCTIQVKMTNPS